MLHLCVTQIAISLNIFSFFSRFSRTFKSFDGIENHPTIKTASDSGHTQTLSWNIFDEFRNKPILI